MIKRLPYSDERCGQLRHQFKQVSGASSVTQLLEVGPNTFRAHCYKHDPYKPKPDFLGEYEIVFHDQGLDRVQSCRMTTRQLQRPLRKMVLTSEEHDALMNFIAGRSNTQEKEIVRHIYVRETK